MVLLSDPLQIGNCALTHRMLMAPMTRLRADVGHVPSDIMAEYYSQRASVPGTLVITEATFISATSRGRHSNAPGVYSNEQIQHWARVCENVHSHKSFIFMQLWHVGRSARKDALQDAGLEAVSSSAIPISEKHSIPRAMTEAEILDCVDSFAQAARNAIMAGCDGVEIHAANGYLIDQFTQDTCNKRNDRWGGSIENRSRFCIEVLKAVCKAVGPERTAVRLSPFSDFQAMGMKDPIPQFTYLISQLKPLGLAYMHLIEPRVAGSLSRDANESENLEFAIKTWEWSAPLVLAGGYDSENASRRLRTFSKDEPVAIAFGRHFIANPDLPHRVAKDIPFTPYNRDTFYTVGQSEGYIDYPFSAK